jgi:hypothetical protein
MEKTALEKAQKLLSNAEADFKFKGEVGVGWAVLAVAEQLERMATIAEKWAKSPM